MTRLACRCQCQQGPMALTWGRKAPDHLENPAAARCRRLPSVRNRPRCEVPSRESNPRVTQARLPRTSGLAVCRRFPASASRDGAASLALPRRLPSEARLGPEPTNGTGPSCLPSTSIFASAGLTATAAGEINWRTEAVGEVIQCATAVPPLGPPCVSVRRRNPLDAALSLPGATSDPLRVRGFDRRA